MQLQEAVTGMLHSQMPHAAHYEHVAAVIHAADVAHQNACIIHLRILRQQSALIHFAPSKLFHVAWEQQCSGQCDGLKL